jgi:hypothetical protein
MDLPLMIWKYPAGQSSIEKLRAAVVAFKEDVYWKRGFQG